jgi:hypothetical protein
MTAPTLAPEPANNEREHPVCLRALMFVVMTIVDKEMMKKVFHILCRDHESLPRLGGEVIFGG